MAGRSTASGKHAAGVLSLQAAAMPATAKNVDWRGLAAFLAITALGATSAPVFNAVAVLSDLLPLQEDLAALLGFPPGTPDINWSYALPGLIALLILLWGASLMPSIANALAAASDILPFPADLEATLMPGTAS